MVKSEPSCPTEVNESKNLTNENKGQSPNSKKYRGKKTWTKYQVPDPKYDTAFNVQCSGLEGYIFDLGPRSLEKFAKTMKDLERFLG